MTERVDKRTLRYAGRREELLAAVTDYVIANGVGEQSIRPLAQAAGVSHASLLNHFGSKEELLSAVVENLRQGSIPMALGTEGDDPVELLKRWWAARTTPEALPRFRLMFEIYAQALLDPARFEQFLEHFVGEWLAALEVGLRRADCPPDRVADTATLILAQVRGLLLDLLATGDRDRVDRAFLLFADTIDIYVRSWQSAGRKVD
ncbi:TetR/AcrR family transcriptional regulator [Rhodococcus tukisamuensis]|uniref:DNA-binding transcriptional regulator, AcrR family n=1 Tax=Rhodococcus tukisamuensis TaxID=168276 RepID=A0A1G6M6H9_9NOCA|nr:TetR/AcrR family transcriptional regulator [Rhodococcus tukisamuensis]SDC50904.1 DNA-binding transcriptional regulator, AcrR family [Rhodococcus tukisamuensis]